MSGPVIALFRLDLRLDDNPALSAAVATGQPVICLYVLDDRNSRALGGASSWWLHHSLADLDRALRACGGELILHRGTTADIVVDIVRTSGATAVYLARRHEPWAANQENELHRRLSSDRVSVHRFAGTLLSNPEVIRTRQDTPFKVFTPFYRAVLRTVPTSQPLPAPARIPAPDPVPCSDDLNAWQLLPRKPDWAGGLRETWTPGATGAQACLDQFIGSALTGYDTARDVPGVSGTSALSPHLNFGEISPRQCRARILFAAKREPQASTAAAAFERQLVWRDFAHHLLHHWPTLLEAPFRPEYASFPWRDDPVLLHAWQRGMTGFPLVDAGMRQLWYTGWMHNRVRMVVASFLVKHLMIPWQAGEMWFWDTLVDADLANNVANWQWVAGCGADAAPYFRVFNPILQSEKFDPRGTYLRRWLPELNGLPDKHIHRPWAAPPPVLADAGITLDKDYPSPIIGHEAGRARALATFQEWRHTRAG
jgi:deoxyribodipyrimidine photo-lyase